MRKNKSTSKGKQGISKINSEARSRSQDIKSQPNRKRKNGNISGDDSDVQSDLTTSKVPNLKWSRVLSLSYQEYPETPVYKIAED